VADARERFISVAPTIDTIGSSGGIAQTHAETGDGLWVRNLSVTFSTEGNETAEPGNPVNTGPPGSSYQDLGPDGLPKLWRVEGGEPGEWEVVDGAKNCSHHGVPTTCNTIWCHNATDTSCGRFMRANVTKWPCASASGSDGKACENRSAILGGHGLPACRGRVEHAQASVGHSTVCAHPYIGVIGSSVGE